MDNHETESITAEQVDQVDEIQEDKIQEVLDDKVTPTEAEDSTKEESGGSFISRVRDAAKAKLFGEAKENVETDEYLPDEFISAAQKMNWSDDDILNFAEGMKQDENGEWIESEDDIPLTDEQLKEMIPSLLGEESAKAEETSDKIDTKSETTEGEVEDSQEDDALKQALARIAALEEKQGISEVESREAEQVRFNQRASDLFDKESEEFEVFGKTDKLPRFPHNGELIPTSPQMKARLEVYSNAMTLKEAGMPGDKALEFSMNAYKGANLKVETKRSAIKELKKREQRLGGKRVSHETTEAANLTGPEVIAEVKRRYGK